MRHFLSIVIFLILFSCSEKKTETPEHIIGKEKMTQLLTDLCLMEGAINVENMNPAHTKTQALKFNLYKQHNITREQFDSSLMYYCRNMEEFRVIQANVLEQLNRKK